MQTAKEAADPQPGPPVDLVDRGLTPEEQSLNRLTEETVARLGDVTVEEILADLPRVGRDLFVKKHGEEYARKLEALIQNGD